MQWFVAILLRDARIAAGLTQAEAAQEFGCHPHTIYYWEKGERHPRPSEVFQIADTYRLSEELKNYLKMILEHRGSKLLQADARFHALTLAKAELHSGVIFKYEPHLIPGPLQTRDYHFLVLKVAEKLTDFVAQQGWEFKFDRQMKLRKRKRRPKIQYLIGDSAMYGLRRLSDSVRREQVNKLLQESEQPDTDLRVIAEYLPGRNTPFSIYEPGESKTAPPTFIYSEILHGSWCIEEDTLVSLYHDAGQAMWQLGIPLKEFLNEYCRDLLA
ncbi:Scr1 family TA system antitoxin-like transcriptional regulator [Glycomyces albidus]|nr:Scr1 family TA system antitoxin-like transcriptional regulator [Glycomyces albidus]